MCHHLLRIRTFASNNYVRTRWDRSRRARGRPAEIVLTAPLVYHAVAISSPYGKLLPSIDSQPSAQEDLLRIQSIGTETETSKRVTEELAKRIIEAEQALSAAKRRQMEADAAIKVAEEAARAEGSDSGVTDTVVRQQLELRKFEADQAALRAQQRIDAAEATQKLAESVSRAERDLEDQEVKAGNAREAAAQSMAKLTVAEEQLRTFSYSSKLYFRRSVCAVN